MAANTINTFDAAGYEKASYNNFQSLLRARNGLTASNAFTMPNIGVGRTITTLTHVIQKVLDATYYTTPLPLTDYVPIDASSAGAYEVNVMQYAEAYVGAPFKQCLVNPASTGIHNDPTADVAIDSITQRNNFYRQTYSISHEEMMMAGKNLIPFNLVESKERSRFKNWQIGLQDTLFIGLDDNRTFGLLNQSDVTVNTSILPVPIQNMTPEQLNTFVGSILGAYGETNNYNFMPNRLYLPTQWYFALSKQVNPNFPLKNLRQTLEDAFNENAGVNDFKIVHAAYGADLGTQGFGRAVLYRHDPDCIVMHTPVPYRPMPLFPQNSLDMMSHAFGQFTGAWVKKPTTILYLDAQAAINPETTNVVNVDTVNVTTLNQPAA